RAQRGLARTWQTVELFDDLSVWENLTVAAKGGSATSVDEELELLDLKAAAEAMPWELSQAERKRGRHRPGAGGPAAAALPGRAGRRAGCAAEPRAGQVAARHRQLRDRGAARRPRHGPGAEQLRAGGGAGLGASDGAGVAGPGARRRAGNRGLPRARGRGSGVMSAAMGDGIPAEATRAGAPGGTATKDAVLEINGLTAGYNGSSVLRDVSLTVRP